jgi:DNA replication protein DnaC
VSNIRRRRRGAKIITNETIEQWEQHFRDLVQDYDCLGYDDLMDSATMVMRKVISLRRRKIIQDYCM